MNEEGDIEILGDVSQSTYSETVGQEGRWSWGADSIIFVPIINQLKFYLLSLKLYLSHI